MADPNQLVQKVISTVESQIDEEINRLETLDSSDLDRIRNERLASMKKEAEQKKLWLSLGHSEYTEIREPDVFNCCKKSSNVVIHFFKHDTPRCAIFDHHLHILAKKHVETRFIKIDAMKAPSLCKFFHVIVIPTLVCVMNNVTKDKVIGFSDLGNCDDYSTEMLEWRLGVAGIIEFDGDLKNPPEKTKIHQKITHIYKKKGGIRNSVNNGGDSDTD